ncbi:MAG: SPOR domain-containing protein, partial [Planktomarina sp.]
LAEMERRFGNLGFAAIGYNGGERRATNFKAGTGGLAGETIDYVKIITGLSAATWRDAPPESVDLRLSQTTDFLSACYQLATNRRLSKPPEPEYAIKPWGVQLAFGTTQAQAKAMYNRNTASCRPLLRNERMDLVAVQNRQKQYFMARIGRTSRDNARKLCLALSNSGCRCSVKQNR